VLTELDKRLIVPSSSTSKGKQRATVEVESEGLREWELPEEFRGEGGVALARSVVDVGTGMGREKEIKERLEGLEFKARIPLFIPPPPSFHWADIYTFIDQIDSLHASLNTALQTTNAVTDDLDARFSLLSLSLSSRSQSLPAFSSALLSNPSTLSNPTLYRTTSLSHPHPDPQDLLRALSRIDVERPPAQIGDEARRAVREVQRVNEGGRVGERRLTITGGAGVGATPRKGTPRRATPGKERWSRDHSLCVQV
jgi:kinetochore protein Mis13/DSN1